MKKSKHARAVSNFSQSAEPVPQTPIECKRFIPLSTRSSAYSHNGPKTRDEMFSPSGIFNLPPLSLFPQVLIHSIIPGKHWKLWNILVLSAQSPGYRPKWTRTMKISVAFYVHHEIGYFSLSPLCPDILNRTRIDRSQFCFQIFPYSYSIFERSKVRCHFLLHPFLRLFQRPRPLGQLSNVTSLHESSPGRLFPFNHNPYTFNTINVGLIVLKPFLLLLGL